MKILETEMEIKPPLMMSRRGARITLWLAYVWVSFSTLGDPIQFRLMAWLISLTLVTILYINGDSE